jgi:hypothetical protein
MDNEQQLKVSYETDDVPTLYCNNVNVTVSFSDLRLYLAEVAPKTIFVNAEAGETTGALNTKSEALVSPKLSVVFNPEFAKSVGQTLLTAVAKYEAIFGSLRTPKSVAQISEAMLQPAPKK